jgi:hypothetical protein
MGFECSTKEKRSLQNPDEAADKRETHGQVCHLSPAIIGGEAPLRAYSVQVLVHMRGLFICSFIYCSLVPSRMRKVSFDRKQPSEHLAIRKGCGGEHALQQRRRRTTMFLRLRLRHTIEGDWMRTT